MTGARRYGITSGGTAFDIVFSHLHLGDGEAGARLVTSAAGVAPASPLASSAPSLTFFTMPNHMLEEFWLEVVPPHLDLEMAIDEQLAAWPGSASLQCLLEAIDPRFGGRIEALLEIGEDGGRSARQPAVVEAWINLDERSRRVAVRACNCTAAIIVEIAAGEGCAWDGTLLDVVPMPPAPGAALGAEPQTRLRISAY